MQAPDLFGIFVHPLHRAAVKYMVSGSLASMQYGEPRLTMDVDLVAHLDESPINRFAEAVRTNTISQLQATRRLSHTSEPGFHATLQLVEPVPGRSLQPSFVLQFSRSGHEHHDSAHALTELSKLTATERDVARLAAAGLKNPESVRKLGVSESTVRTHLRNIFRKLGITSRGKLAPLHRSLDAQ